MSASEQPAPLTTADVAAMVAEANKNLDKLPMVSRSWVDVAAGTMSTAVKRLAAELARVTAERDAGRSLAGVLEYCRTANSYFHVEKWSRQDGDCFWEAFTPGKFGHGDTPEAAVAGLEVALKSGSEAKGG